MYRKLKRVFSYGEIDFIFKQKFIKEFPELKNVDSEELGKRFRSLNLEFYKEDVVKVHPLVRLTMPFAIILFLIMLLGLPIKFLITGSWQYDLSSTNIILNWFKSVRIQ